MEKLLNVSSFPHVRDKSSTKSIMRDVCIALIPATLVGIGNFGVRALLVILTTCVSTVLAEYVWQRLMKQKVTTYDFSALLTGLLLALNLPATLPLWMCVIGGVFVWWTGSELHEPGARRKMLFDAVIQQRYDKQFCDSERK